MANIPRENALAPSQSPGKNLKVKRSVYIYIKMKEQEGGKKGIGEG